jgi:hypothetical protein
MATSMFICCNALVADTKRSARPDMIFRVANRILLDSGFPSRFVMTTRGRTFPAGSVSVWSILQRWLGEKGAVGTFVLVGDGGDGNDPLFPPLSGVNETEWGFVGPGRGGFQLSGQ